MSRCKMRNLLARHHRDIPFDKDPSQKMLPWMLGLMMFLATVTLLGAKILADVSQQTFTDHPKIPFDSSLILLYVFGSLLMAGVIGLVAVICTVFITYNGLESHKKTLKILELIGAPHRYIARQFQRHILYTGLKGCVIGVVLTFLTLALLNGFLNIFTVYARTTSSLMEISGILLLTPLLMLMMVVVAARLTAWSVLDDYTL